MPVLLADPKRLGADTVATLELAAIQRSSEAFTLRSEGHGLAAIYLYGHSAEMRIKAAYFRFVFRDSRLDPRTAIDPARRQAAAGEFLSLGLLKKPGAHDVLGWAGLLVSKRASLAAQYPPDLGIEVVNQARLLSRRWIEIPRYRANEPYAHEVRVVCEVAEWFRLVYPQL